MIDHVERLVGRGDEAGQRGGRGPYGRGREPSSLVMIENFR